MRITEPTQDLVEELVKRKVITKQLHSLRGNKHTYKLSGLVTMIEEEP